LRKSLAGFIDSEHEELLDFIPFEQITSVAKDPIGEGARGIVFSGWWSCPKKTDMAEAEVIHVALKAMKPSPDGQKRFLKEV